MGVSGQLHGPAALSPGKEPLVPLDRRLSGLQSRSGHDGEEKSSLATSLLIRGCIQKFPDWPPGAKTENGRALWH
jgi:hypothetical protein